MLGTVTRSTLVSSVFTAPIVNVKRFNSLQASFLVCSPANCYLKSSAAGIDFPAAKLFHISAL